MAMTLPARPPFSLAAVINSHGWVELAPFGRDEQSDGLSRVERLDSGQVVELTIREAENGVSIEVKAPLTQSEQEKVAEKVTWMLELDQDLSAFYALARGEPKLAQVEAGARGRILRSPTLFEDVVKTILTTNTAWGGAIRMVNALVSQFGSPLPADPTRHAFPTSEQLAATAEAILRTETRLGYRSPYVLALARTVAAGDLDLEALRTADIPSDQLRKQLLAIKGVGAYAVAHLLMILGRYDFLPVDSWAIKVVSHEWYNGEPIGPEEVKAAFEPWGQWKGLAYWFWEWSYLQQ